ncbi:MAG: hypothetical protein U0168_21240 [Nannocystaceae bacterium]
MSVVDQHLHVGVDDCPRRPAGSRAADQAREIAREVELFLGHGAGVVDHEQQIDLIGAAEIDVATGGRLRQIAQIVGAAGVGIGGAAAGGAARGQRDELRGRRRRHSACWAHNRRRGSPAAPPAMRGRTMLTPASRHGDAANPLAA